MEELLEELIKEYCALVSIKKYFNSVSLSATKLYLDCETTVNELISKEINP